MQLGTSKEGKMMHFENTGKKGNLGIVTRQAEGICSQGNDQTPAFRRLKDQWKTNFHGRHEKAQTPRKLTDTAEQ